MGSVSLSLRVLVEGEVFYWMCSANTRYSVTKLILATLIECCFIANIRSGLLS